MNVPLATISKHPENDIYVKDFDYSHAHTCKVFGNHPAVCSLSNHFNMIHTKNFKRI
jgi:hypothetical protein